MKNKKANAMLKLESHDRISYIDNLTSRVIFARNKSKSRPQW